MRLSSTIIPSHWGDTICCGPWTLDALSVNQCRIWNDVDFIFLASWVWKRVSSPPLVVWSYTDDTRAAPKRIMGFMHDIHRILRSEMRKCFINKSIESDYLISQYGSAKHLDLISIYAYYESRNLNWRLCNWSLFMVPVLYILLVITQLSVSLLCVTIKVESATNEWVYSWSGTYKCKITIIIQFGLIQCL